MSTERGDRAHVLTDHSDRGLSSPKTDTRCEVRQRLPEPLTRFRAGNLHHGIEFLALGARGGGEARRSFRRVELPALCRAITSSKVGVARTGEAPAKGFELAVSAGRDLVGIAAPPRSEPLVSATV
jgi:hypothetical protein